VHKKLVGASTKAPKIAQTDTALGTPKVPRGITKPAKARLHRGHNPVSNHRKGKANGMAFRGVRNPKVNNQPGTGYNKESIWHTKRPKTEKDRGTVQTAKTGLIRTRPKNGLKKRKESATTKIGSNPAPLGGEKNRKEARQGEPKVPKRRKKNSEGDARRSKKSVNLQILKRTWNC